MENRFIELDKSISKQIAKELEGKEWEVDCDSCGGKGYYETPYFKRKKKWKCKVCGGEGSYKMIC